MGEVVTLQSRKGTREGNGPAKCLACGHEWTGAIPLPIPPDLQCPKCEMWRGVAKGNWAPPESYAVFTCNCGCTVYNFVVSPEGVESTVCIGCGSTKA